MFSSQREYEISDEAFLTALTQEQAWYQSQINDFQSDACRIQAETYCQGDALDQYLRDLVAQEKEHMAQLADAERFSGRTMNPSDKPPEAWEDDFLGRKLSFSNEVTHSGSLFDNCRYRLRETIKTALMAMDSLYDVLEFDSGFVFEDPAFYSKNRCVGRICSHEGFSNLELDEMQYDAVRDIVAEFQQLAQQKSREEEAYDLSDEDLETLMNLQLEGIISDEEALAFVRKHGTPAIADSDIVIITDDA